MWWDGATGGTSTVSPLPALQVEGVANTALTVVVGGRWTNGSGWGRGAAVAQSAAAAESRDREDAVEDCQDPTDTPVSITDTLAEGSRSQ